MVLAEKRSSERVSRFEHYPQKKRRPRFQCSLYSYVKVVLLALFCISLGLLYTSRHAKIVNLSYNSDSVQQEITSLQKDNKRLELKIAALQAPERVEKIARQELGMEEAGGVLLAALPTGHESGAEQKLSSSDNKDWEKKLLFVARKFVGQAEASAR